jgi:hypothetical protein
MQEWQFLQAACQAWLRAYQMPHGKVSHDVLYLGGTVTILVNKLEHHTKNLRQHPSAVLPARPATVAAVEPTSTAARRGQCGYATGGCAQQLTPAADTLKQLHSTGKVSFPDSAIPHTSPHNTVCTTTSKPAPASAMDGLAHQPSPRHHRTAPAALKHSTAQKLQNNLAH